MNGHKFVQRQFYQLMMCALCGEFLLNAAGYQCEDCRYTCHKKCYSKVVTKCISKSNTAVGVLFLALYVYLSWVFRMATKRRSTIVFLIVSSLSPTSAQTGAATVVTCFHLAVKTPGSAQNVTSPATQTVLTSCPTSVECLWRRRTSCFVIGVTSTGLVAERAPFPKGGCHRSLSRVIHNSLMHPWLHHHISNNL